MGGKKYFWNHDTLIYLLEHKNMLRRILFSQIVSFAQKLKIFLANKINNYIKK
jgi:hypothetical protein